MTLILIVILLDVTTSEHIVCYSIETKSQGVFGPIDCMPDAPAGGFLSDNGVQQVCTTDATGVIGNKFAEDRQGRPHARRGNDEN